MTDLSNLWKYFRFITPLDAINKDEKETIAGFLKEEYKAREIKKIQYLTRISGLKRIKLIEDLDWTFNPKTPKEKVMEFINSKWIDNPSNLVLIGPSGVGKTHIASAICYQAIQKGYTTIFITCHDLVAKLTKVKNVYSMIDHYSKVKVFCLDELGYVFPSQEQANLIFQIISKRSEMASTIITTNLVPSNWGKLFDSSTATAILDRLSLKGIFITIEGRSYRNKK